MGKRPIRSAGRPDDSCGGGSAVKREAACSTPECSPRLPPRRTPLGPATHACRMHVTGRTHELRIQRFRAICRAPGTKHGHTWPRVPERRPIEEGGHRAMRRPRCENSHGGHCPRGGRSDRPSMSSCERPAARDRAAEPFSPRLHPETRGSSSRTVPAPEFGQVGWVVRALPSSFEPLRDAFRVRDVRHASPLEMCLKPRLSCRRPSVARLSLAGAKAPHGLS